MRPELVKIGVITSAHGVHGEVRVFSLTDFPERFETLRRALLGPDARPVNLRFKGIQKNVILLKLEGVEDRDQAEKLRQQYLQVPVSELHPLPEGSYYVFDLIGLDVVDPEGKPLGKLVDVDQSSPVHDLYVIETAPRKQAMVPAVGAFVKAIDLQKGQVVIQPIPGLLDEE